MNKIVAKLIKVFFPWIYWKTIIKKLRDMEYEHEMVFLPLLCDKEKTSLDIGAAAGIFSVKMSSYSKKVIAFEPIHSNVLRLENMFRYIKKEISVEEIALSNFSGKAELRILPNELGRSTIEEANKLDHSPDIDEKTITVKVNSLDNYNLTKVGFIKIDVEGHEEAVLKGAKETIAQNKPKLLVEIEERHKEGSLNNIQTLLREHGYQGYFLHDNNVYDIETFNINYHQNSDNIGGIQNNYKRVGIYINNFIFVPLEETETFKKSAISVLEGGQDKRDSKISY